MLAMRLPLPLLRYMLRCAALRYAMLRHAVLCYATLCCEVHLPHQYACTITVWLFMSSISWLVDTVEHAVARLPVLERQVDRRLAVLAARCSPWLSSCPPQVPPAAPRGLISAVRVRYRSGPCSRTSP